MNYEVIYDISNEMYKGWMFELISIMIFVGVTALALIILKKIFQVKIMKFLIYLIFIVLLIIAFSTLSNISKYNNFNEIKTLYLNKNFKIAEGVVQNVNIQYGRYNKQSFTVNKERFEISENKYTVGYNKTVQKGGAIKEGRYVKITFVEQSDDLKAICKLEIKKNK